MDNVSYRLEPIDPAVADTLREGGGIVSVADTFPGFPCRQCLRDADVGDEMILVSHDPFTRPSPYRSASPIFLHRYACEPPVDRRSIPPQLTGRQLSVRSFDDRAMMIDAAIVDGTDLALTIERLFTDKAAARLHVHNASRGCWAVTVER